MPRTFWILGFSLLSACAIAWAAPPASTLPKVGSCPTGYSSSNEYCVPGSSARYAVLKKGSCPSGYSSSNEYCVAVSDTSKTAIPKSGSCPSGCSSSNDYCLCD